MSKLSQLTLPIKDPSTGDISVQMFDIGGGEVDTELSPTSTNAVQNKKVYEALASKVDTSSVGAASGVAGLNSNGKVPGTQLPTFVGTTAEWNALTSAQQAVYDERQLTDDSADAREMDPIPTQNSQNVVSSGGIYSFVVGTLLTQTLAAGSTSVTFTGIPTTGNNIIKFYTSSGINYTALDNSTPGQVTITFEEQEAAITVYCRINEV